MKIRSKDVKANKIFFDLYSTCGGKMPYEEYRKWYDQHDTVYIVLMDKGIYTKVRRQEMFDKGLQYGCFIEHCPYDTPEEVREHALKVVQEHNLMFVEPDEFVKLEKEQEDYRVAKAFQVAEQMIRGS